MSSSRSGRLAATARSTKTPVRMLKSASDTRGLSALGAGGEDEEEGVAEEDGGVEVAHLHQRLVVGGPVVATRDGLIEREHGVTHGTEIGHHQGERAFDVGVLHLDGH